MSTYILMKILESFPSKYDKGIRFITSGKLEEAYDRLASFVKKGDRVLDLGCGTGALSLRAARRGAWVKGIDINSRMLDEAKVRAEKANLIQNIEFSEMGVAELDREKGESYDAVMSGLCLSELSDDEFNFAIKEVERVLKPQGLFLAADEVRPQNFFKKIIHGLLRFFFKATVYFLTGSSTKAIHRLPEKLGEMDFFIVNSRLNKWENFLELVARKQKG